MKKKETEKGKLKLTVEATTLHNLEYVMHPEKEMSWKIFLEVLYLIEMLVLSDKVIYSGKSMDRVKEKIRKLIDEFESEVQPKTFFEFGQDFNENENDFYTRSAAEASSSFFFIEDKEMIINKINWFKNEVNVNEVSPTPKNDSKKEERFPIKYSEWHDFLKIIKDDTKDIEDWIGVNCFKKDNTKGEQINGGKAFFYGVLNEKKNTSESSSNGLDFINFLLNTKSRLLNDYELLQFMNVGFRLHLNNNLAYQRQSLSENKSDILIYSPNIARSKLFNYDNQYSFTSIHNDIFKGMEEIINEITGYSNIREHLEELWKIEKPYPFIGLMVLQKLKEDTNNQIKSNLIEVIQFFKENEDIIRIRECLVKSLKKYNKNSIKDNNLVVDNSNLSIELAKCSGEISKEIRKKLFNSNNDENLVEIFNYVFTAANIGTQCFGPDLQLLLAIEGLHLGSNIFLKKVLKRFSTPKYNLIPGLIQNLSKVYEKEIYSLAHNYCFKKLEVPFN